jgi:hypothetical protein
MMDMNSRTIVVPTKELMDKLAKIYEAKGAKIVEVEGDIVAYFPSGFVVHILVMPDVVIEDPKRFLLMEAMNGTY